MKPRPDVVVHFVSGNTAVEMDTWMPGDYIDRPVGYTVNPLVIAEIRNGAVTQEGFVFTEHNEILRESIDRRSYMDAFVDTHPNIRSELQAAPLAANAETVILLASQRATNYFHWWIDVLARCWVVDNSPYASCQLVSPPLSRRFQHEALDLLGQNVTVMTQPLQRFRSLTFTRGLTYGSSQNIAPQVVEFARWCRAALELPATPTGRKLVLSRKAARGRGIANELELLAALGTEFESVELEAMGVAEQASLFAQADVVVAPHGAGLTNLLFCNRPTAVVELVQREAPPPYTYRRLARLLGHSYFAIGCRSVGSSSNVTRPMVEPDVEDVVDAVARLGNR